MTKPTVLVIEDDKVMRQAIERLLVKIGHKVLSAGQGREGLGLFKSNRIDLVLLDMRLPDMNGMEVLGQLKRADEDAIVIMLTAYPDVQTAVATMKAGAYDYIVKPFDSDQLKYAIDRALGTRELKSEVLRLRHEHGRRTHARKLVGNSLAIKQLRELIARVAVANPPVLIQGESGTGKELVADAIHESSPRASRALIKVNCSAIPADLVESELFGHEKGAYTGADRAKAGLFELADGGTLFLDEISEMQLALQPKLLRVIEGHSFRRVGGVKDTSVDVRLVAATNNDLRACVDAGTFRADLFYRLGVLVIDVPPLRVRTEDVLLIAETVIEELRVETGKSVSGLSKEAQELLVGYSWPGNVRELRNVLERAVILADSILLEPADFPSELSTHPDLHQMEPETEKAVPKSLESIERSHIAQVLAFTGGNKTEAAKRLGIARSTLKEKIKNLKID